MHGLYIEVAPPTRPAHTVRWDAPVGYNQPELTLDEVAIVTLTAAAAGCQVNYLHIGVPNRGAADGHRQGLLQSFKLLRAHLAEQP